MSCTSCSPLPSACSTRAHCLHSLHSTHQTCVWTAARQGSPAGPRRPADVAKRSGERLEPSCRYPRVEEYSMTTGDKIGIPASYFTWCVGIQSLPDAKGHATRDCMESFQTTHGHQSSPGLPVSPPPLLCSCYRAYIKRDTTICKMLVSYPPIGGMMASDMTVTTSDVNCACPHVRMSACPHCTTTPQPSTHQGEQARRRNVSGTRG